ncbi:hypothetical protein ACFE33_15795 (plasmid) [Falsihalocynthiibacter sp. SS001]|uniref:hypothetical protein n=1 Tax=Falsihalocynthiibacter sp. SS001 TaxID=3349698 RepID=UPI0036D2E530
MTEPAFHDPFTTPLTSQNPLLETDQVRAPRRKALVLVHPGSLFGSGDFNVGRRAAGNCREHIRNQLLAHEGQLVIIDGYLSDEITEEFEEAIQIGLDNALIAAHRAERLEPMSALRIWGCDGGEAPFSGWEGFGSECLPHVFNDQMAAAKVLCQYLTADEIEVTGAWATEDGRWGCVNSVAEVLRTGLPDTKVRISETALFEVYGSRTDTITPHFNLELDTPNLGGSNGHS